MLRFCQLNPRVWYGKQCLEEGTQAVSSQSDQADLIKFCHDKNSRFCIYIISARQNLQLPLVGYTFTAIGGLSKLYYVRY